MRGLRLVVLALVFAVPALAVDINGTVSNWTWTHSTGPVVGYTVEVSRNGGPFVPQGDVGTNHATVTGAAGETIIVRIVAFNSDKSVTATSPLSDPATFKPIVITPPGKPTLE